MVQELQASQAAEAAIQAQRDSTHQEQLVALTQHYQRQLADLSLHFWAQIPGKQEPPASIFAPPLVVPLPVPLSGQVSTMPVALACTASLQVLITPLGLCAGTVGGFELDSKW
jgi:hypothetical protein